MCRLLYQHQEQPRPPQHGGEEKRWTLIVNSEPVLLGRARLSFYESLIESTRLFTPSELMHQTPLER
jgi:hypothetical protein